MPYRVPGMENETILPHAEQSHRRRAGRWWNGGVRPPPRADRRPRPRPGSGRYGVRNFGDPTPPAPQPGVLTGNGSVFIGTKGIMATVDRGEGVHLLPAARWAEYVLPPQLLTRSPATCWIGCARAKAANRSCSDFSISRALCGVVGAGRDCLACSRQTGVGRDEHAFHEQPRGQSVRQAGFQKGRGTEALIRSLPLIRARFCNSRNTSSLRSPDRWRRRNRIRCRRRWGTSPASRVGARL